MTYTDRPTTLSRLYDSLGEIYKCPKYGGLREVAREAAVFGSVGTEQAAVGRVRWIESAAGLARHRPKQPWPCEELKALGGVD
jgi:hypothetical protein